MAKQLLSALLTVLALLCWPQLVRAADESVPCAVEPTNMLIGYGNVIACSLSSTIDNDTFRFNGLVGHRIILQITNPGEFLINPCIELFAPRGVLVTSACGGFSARIGAPVFDLDESGECGRSAAPVGAHGDICEPAHSLAVVGIGGGV